MHGLALARTIALTPSAQRSGFPGLSSQREHHLSSHNHSLVKPNEASTKLAPKPRTNTQHQRLFCPFYNRSARAGPKCGSASWGKISATDWHITALAPPTPDLHDDSCPDGRSTMAHDGPSMIYMDGGSGCISGAEANAGSS